MEVSEADLRSSSLQIDCLPKEYIGADFYVITVPTPIDDQNQPDLRALESAAETVGGWLNGKLKSIVVCESTVYPGVTETVVGKIVEQTSGLKMGADFSLGYSPERINPGDQIHGLKSVTKIVAGENSNVTNILAELYGKVNDNNCHCVPTIQIAEAAKLIENAQRDINIAFINEVACIMAKKGIPVWEVLDAANTKWNFLPFKPGLVGGHCIGVDPYYLSHFAEKLGVDASVTLSGRRINDRMAEWVANSILEAYREIPANILVLGLTFKPNVPDLRNTKILELVRLLAKSGAEVTLYDPFADPDTVQLVFEKRLEQNIPEKSFDIVVGAVAHDAIMNIPPAQLTALVNVDNGLVADIPGMWRENALPKSIGRWSF